MSSMQRCRIQSNQTYLHMLQVLLSRNAFVGDLESLKQALLEVREEGAPDYDIDLMN